MLKFFIAAMAAASALAAAPTQAASTYEIEATSVSPYYTDFTLTFEDLDGDALFSVDELLTFSGFTYYGTTFMSELTAAPTLDGISDGGYTCCGTLPAWAFYPGTGFLYFAIDAPNWTYTLTEQTAAVPLPAAGLLLAGGWRASAPCAGAAGRPEPDQGPARWGHGLAYFSPAQKVWMRRQASSSTFSEVA